jgi:DNA-directed RNA polymerase subunit alpha
LLIVQRPQIIEETTSSENRTKFIIEPLEPGFGYTLGNALRRTLLSSIPGAAVTQIRIDGVLHEFSTIPGAKEDVTDVILNLKDLVIRSESDEPVAIHLRVQGPKDVVAGDITAPTGVEILNPDQHIETINKKGRIDVEIVV